MRADTPPRTATREEEPPTVGAFRLESEVERQPIVGTAYEAIDPATGTRALVTVVSSDSGPERAERFLADVERLERAQTRGLPTVLDRGEGPLGTWVATTPVDGRPLSALIGEEGLVPMRALRLLGEAADALDAAHAQGLVHGDLSPEAITVRELPLERAELWGFALGGRPEHAVPQGRYRSPEERRGGPASAAGDRYALACVLLEALTGAPPGPAGPEGSALSPELRRVVSAGLASDPAERPATAGELLADAARVLVRGTPVPAEAPPDEPREEPTSEMPAPPPQPRGASTGTASEVPPAPTRRRRGGLLGALGVSGERLARMRGAVGGHASPAPPAPAPARGTEPQAESEATAREEAERERSAALERETREREAQEREAQEAREREAREAEERAAQEAREREAREAEEREAREAAARAPREAAAREAEEHARRPTDDTEQPPADRRAWRAPAIAAALLVLAGVAGFLAGRAGDEQETAPQQSSQVSAGPVSATVPPGWSRSEEPTAGGLAIRRPFLTATAPDGARLNAGLLEAGSGLLYPARVAAEALRSPSRPRSVTAGQADGWRFDGRTRRGTRPATLFLLPGSSGLLAVLCSGPEASLPGCQSAAATVEARGSRPVSPVSLTRYARRASRILGALSSARGRDRRALRRAPLRRTQARVSRRLARSFEGAARGLRPRVPAAVRGPISQLTAALQRAARGYAALGRATARTDRRAYRRAAQMIEAAEADVRRAEARL